MFPDTVTKVKFHTVNDRYVCPVCQELAEKEFEVQSAPTLPYHKCVNPEGCRCWITPIVDLKEVENKFRDIFNL